MSRPTDPIFAEFEKIVLSFGGRPHLGKKVYFRPDQIGSFYLPETIRSFHRVRMDQDPKGKFWNVFCEARFGGGLNEGITSVGPKVPALMMSSHGL